MLILFIFHIDIFLAQAFIDIWPNYNLHPLSLVKVQFSPLSFDCVNSIL